MACDTSTSRPGTSYKVSERGKQTETREESSDEKKPGIQEPLNGERRGKFIHLFAKAILQEKAGPLFLQEAASVADGH